jgi:hypothetical protein
LSSSRWHCSRDASRLDLNASEYKPDSLELDICNGMIDDVARKRCLDAAYADKAKRVDAQKAAAAKK